MRCGLLQFNFEERLRSGERNVETEGIFSSMKKMMVFGALLLGSAVGYAQESRQDISLSGFAELAPTVQGRGITSKSTITTGILASYRYMVTPRSALEVNYGFAQYTTRYVTSGSPQFFNAHTRQQEFSGAYVYTRNYKRYNPFLQAGIGTLIFSPILDNGTTQLDAKRNLRIGALFGGGVAYELSPSFDIRVEYRGFLVKAPDFKESFLNLNRYYVNNMPAVGIAYHF